jgi:hypothetical protein
MALNYALALGGEFDVVLNLDGFNEVASYPANDRPAGVSPLFPTGWQYTAVAFPDATVRRLIGQATYLGDARAKWARSCMAAPWRHSVTAGLLWKFRDRHLNGELTRSALALGGHKPEFLPYCAIGPSYPGQRYAGDREMYEDLVAIWKRCSVQLDRICRGHGIQYYHFLQPNQYVAGSKEMGPAERRVAYDANARGKPSVEQGYPLLRKGGKDLSRRGVRFRDLTMAFAGVKEQTYVDNCCHLNQKGHEALAAEMARLIVETPEPPAGPTPAAN